MKYVFPGPQRLRTSLSYLLKKNMIQTTLKLCMKWRRGCDVLAEVPAVNMDSEDELFHATATSGHSLQLACDVHAAQRLVWTRLGQSLHSVPQFKASCRLVISLIRLFKHIIYSKSKHDDGTTSNRYVVDPDSSESATLAYGFSTTCVTGLNFEAKRSKIKVTRLHRAQRHEMRRES